MEHAKNLTRRGSTGPFLWTAAIQGIILLASGPAEAQLKSPTERLRDLEVESQELKAANEELTERLKALEEKIASTAGEAKPAKDAKNQEFFSTGVLTIGGVELTLGGKVEILFIDSESEDDPIVGSTDEPDPHFELDRLQIRPDLKFNREISVRGQIELKPEKGDSFLRELTVRHKLDSPVWWFGSEAQLGLEDRFMKPVRRTDIYPLIGEAFWHDESLAFTWVLRLGDKDVLTAAAPSQAGVQTTVQTANPPAALLDQGGLGLEESILVEQPSASETVVVETAPGPFDFARNPGEFKLYFSVGSGYALNNNEIGNDGASFNDLVQDDRNITDDISIREIGVGLGYERIFHSLGELEVMGFYYNDELSDTSLAYLQDELTVRDLATGAPLAGYGDSDARNSDRYGVGAYYFLPASMLYDSKAIRANDGLRLAAQWIQGTDGKLRRRGWYVQGSYRYSFPERLIAGRYFRSVEPLVRYGALNVNLSPTAELPGTWDREELVLGLLVDVTGEVKFKIEYAFHGERTGGYEAPGPASVDNDELMVMLLLEF